MIRQLYSESRGARPLFTDVVEKLVSAAQHAGEPGDLQFAPTGNGGWRADVPAFA
jgi:hypothetical protein